MKFLKALIAFQFAILLFTKVNAVEPIFIDAIGLATPESIEYYADEDVYLVTNINGNPLEADGNGFISKIGPDGKVIDLRWIDGARSGIRINAPKGAAINGNILYVADLDEVHLFDLPSGRQLTSVKINGSTFLNGITPGDGDTVYVTDSGLKAGEGGFMPSGSDAIYQISASGKYRAILKDKGMGRPNGIVSNQGKLTIVTFGSGSIFTIDEAGRLAELTAPPNGGLDGLLSLDDGSYVLSSWEGSAIYRLNPAGSYEVLANALDAPADIGYDDKRKRILVPLFKQNRLAILPLDF
jgi:sugar lactone lactonase YvrE